MPTVQFYVDRMLAPRAERAQTGTFLIGSYAGWPNFGDYLQIKSTIDFYVKIGAHNIFLLLDIGARTPHRQNLVKFDATGTQIIPVYYDLGQDASRCLLLDDLIALPDLPPSLFLHVYGGGFINDLWGKRCRTAINGLLQYHAQVNVDSQPRLFMSGLQVCPSAEIHKWQPLFAQAAYIGARDEETIRILEGLLDGNNRAKVQYSGDDALPALAAALENEGSGESTLTVSVHTNLAEYSSSAPERRLKRISKTLAAVAHHFGSGLICDLLVAYPSDHVQEEEAAHQLEAIYARSVTAGEAPPLKFRRRNVFKEIVDGTFRFDASFLVTCSYHIALTGLLSNCPTLLLADNDYYRQKAAGLRNAFKSHDFGVLREGDDVEAAVRSLLAEGTNRPPGNGSHAMWAGQLDKAVRLAGIHFDMEKARARNHLELTASAFREVATDLGELRKRRILEKRLSSELAARGGNDVTHKIAKLSRDPSRYLMKSYWRNRKNKILRSIRKRIDAGIQ